jgi:hypothetical protein
MLKRFACLFILGATIAGIPAWAMQVIDANKEADGAILTMHPGLLRLEVMSDAVIRVT